MTAFKKVVPEIEQPAPRALLRRFGMLLGIAAVAVVLRAAYEQVGNTVALWTERADRGIGTFTIPMTWFQALDPLLVMVLTPLLVASWHRLARRGREPQTMSKMSLGAAVIAVAYLLLAGNAAWVDLYGGRCTWPWVAAFFLILTTGELYVLPVGLGLFGRLAPPGFMGTSIAIWYLGAFAGNLLAGALGAAWGGLTPAAFFTVTGAIAGMAALLLLFFKRAVVRAEDQSGGNTGTPSESSGASQTERTAETGSVP